MGGRERERERERNENNLLGASQKVYKGKERERERGGREAGRKEEREAYMYT
jgi:hypothetical protein